MSTSNQVQGLGVAYRMNPDGSTFSSPVENLASDDMACGIALYSP